MNSRFVVILIAILCVIGGAVYYFTKGTANKTEYTAKTAPTAWIEVVSPDVSAKDAQGIVRAIKTGDEVKAGENVLTGDKGQAIIHISDGSVMRLDSNTGILLDSASFDKNSNTLIVRATLAVGRVWSKIIALGSPESAWEVKTTNAVATVRGTAFGVEYKGGVAKFIGSEHKVKVAVIDPATSKPSEKAVVSLDESSVVQIKDIEVKTIIAKPEKLAVEAAPVSVSEDPWIKDNKSKDEIINIKVEEIKKENPSEEKFREKIQESVQEEFQSEIKAVEQNAVPEKTSEGDTPEQNTLPKTDQGVVVPAIKTQISPTKGTTATKPVSMSISTSASLDAVVEGTTVNLSALVKFSDGSTKDVTKDAAWSVDGPIGSFVSPGIYLPSFRSEDSEVESLAGTVSASWTGGGATLKASPLPVTIIHAYEETIPQG